MNGNRSFRPLDAATLDGRGDLHDRRAGARRQERTDQQNRQEPDVPRTQWNAPLFLFAHAVRVRPR